MTDTPPASVLDNPLGLDQDIMGEIVAYTYQAGQITEVTDTATNDAVKELRARLKSLDSRIDGARIVAKAPFLQSGKMIDSLAKVIFDLVRPEIARLDRLRLAYAESFKAPPQMPFAVPVNDVDLALRGPPDLSSLAIGVSAAPPEISTMTRRDIEVTDALLIPREFLVVDMVALRRAVLTDKRDVPGVRIIEKTTVRE